MIIFIITSSSEQSQQTNHLPDIFPSYRCPKLISVYPYSIYPQSTFEALQVVVAPGNPFTIEKVPDEYPESNRSLPVNVERLQRFFEALQADHEGEVFVPSE